MIFYSLLVVMATVLLGIVSAVLLKEAASQHYQSWLTMGLIFLGVLFVNGLRFVLWGMVHRRYQLSLTYPLNSIFFPLIFCVGHFYYGETVTLQKIVGTFLIVGGVVALTYFNDAEHEV